MIIISTKGQKILLITIPSVIAAAVAVAAVFFIMELTKENVYLPQADAVNEPAVPEHTYNLDNIISEGDKKYYYDNDELSSQLGVDISYAQKEIDWNKVHDSGIDFAMIRLGYRGYESGKINIDEYFDTNVQKASEAGVGVGVYFFSQAVNKDEAVEEANFVIDKIKNYNITYPVAFDWEDISHEQARTDDIDGQTLTDCAKAFCDTVSGAGYTPLIYSSLNLLREQFEKYDRTQMLDNDFWLAEYKEKPEYKYGFSMWQYTETGKVNGINDFVDLNIYFKKK